MLRRGDLRDLGLLLPDVIQNTRPVFRSVHMFVSLAPMRGVSQLAPRSAERTTPLGGPAMSISQAGRKRTLPALVTTILSSPTRAPVLVTQGIGASDPSGGSILTPPAR